MCSKRSPWNSFSSDTAETDVMQIVETDSRTDMSLLDSNSDFEFSIGSSFGQESCSADELFSNGVIIPTQIRETPREIHEYEPLSPSAPVPPLPIVPCPSPTEDAKKESMKEALVVGSNSDQKPQSKSFWGFKRCSSLNCEGKTSLLCSLPLLSRSSSTSSVSSKIHKQNTQKQAYVPLSKSCSSSSSCSSQSSSQKPPLKKNYGGGVRINPVLHVPTPYISTGASNLFGFGTFLSNRREHKKKKPKK